MTEKLYHPKVLRSEYWRQRAQEAREAIKDITNPANKKILEEVAQSYDDMADLVEGHDQSAGPPRPQLPPTKVFSSVAGPQICVSGTR